MELSLSLFDAGVTAVCAAEALASSTMPTSYAKQLNLADHAQVLQRLRFTVTGITYAHGLLPHALAMLERKRETYTRLGSPSGEWLATQLATLHGTANRALARARPAEQADAAYLQVRDDVRELARRNAPAAQPASPRNGIAALIAGTDAQLAAFQTEMTLAGGPIGELTTVFGATSTIVRALKDTCCREAVLVDGAYQAARMTRRAPVVAEAITTVSTALDNASTALFEAFTAAKKLSDHERRLAHAI